MKRKPVILLTSVEEKDKAVGRALKERGYRVVNAKTKRGIKRGLKQGVDLVLIDSGENERWSGIEICRTIRSEEDAGHLPIILLVEEEEFTERGEEILSNADEVLIRPVDMRVFQSVVNHFIQKKSSNKMDTQSLLPEARGIELLGNITPSTQLEMAAGKDGGVKLWDLLIDPLTGLFNRSYLDLRLEEEFKRARRYGFAISYFLLHASFESLDPTYAQDSSVDLAIKEIAGTLLSESRDVDIVARTGSQEFSILAPNTDAEELVTMAKRLTDRIINHFDSTEQDELRLLLRAGTASYPNKLIKNERMMVELAAEALEKAVQFGRSNRVCIWECPGFEEIKE